MTECSSPLSVTCGAMARVPKDALGPRGVIITKDTLTLELKIAPGLKQERVEIIRAYDETPEDLWVPAAYARETWPHAAFEDQASRRFNSLDIRFTGTLQPDQQRVCDTYLRALESNHVGGVIQCPPGWGKCLGKGTPVMLSDGRVVPVESVVVGDTLMGPDGKPRKVLSTSSGYGGLFRITPTRGEPWICNADHILTLVESGTGRITDISLSDWADSSETFRHHHKLFTVGVRQFDSGLAEPPVDPYFLGVWFGDGHKGVRPPGIIEKVAVSKPDPEIEDLCRDTASAWGLTVRVERSGRCPTYYLSGDGRVNPLLTALRDIVGRGIVVPDCVLRGSFKTRAAFLAGFLDTDANLQGRCYYVITQKRKDWARAVWWIARSLGLSSVMSSRTARDQNGTVEVYWVVRISGDVDILPLRIPRKRAGVRLQKKVATRTGFSVDDIGDGDYFGFTLSGDGRFLLGDFTVTHNTVGACYLIARLGAPTLILVHKEFLAEQWAERIHEFMGAGTRVGIVQEDRWEWGPGYDITIALVQTLLARGLPPGFNRWFSFLVADECLSGDTEIVTDTGTIRIDEFPESGAKYVLSFDEHRGWVWREVLRWLPKGVRPVIRVKTDGQTLVCTPDHQVLTHRGWVRAGDLLPGDRLSGCAPVDVGRRWSWSIRGGARDRIFRCTISECRTRRLIGRLAARPWSKVLRCVLAGVEDLCGSDAILSRPELQTTGGLSIYQGTAGGGSNVRRYTRMSSDFCTGRCSGTRASYDHIKQPIHGSPSLTGQSSENGRSTRPDGLMVLGYASPNLATTDTARPSTGESVPAYPPLLKSSGSLALHGRLRGSGSGGFPRRGLRGGTWMTVRYSLPGLRWSRFIQRVSRQARFGVLPDSFPVSGSSRPSARSERTRSSSWIPRVRGGGSGRCASIADRVWTTSFQTVRSVTPSILVPVFDLDVDAGTFDGHNFLANGVVVHNCHRHAATTWHHCLKKIRAGARLGLSATPMRKDGMDALIQWHIGPVVARSRKQALSPKVYRFSLPTSVPRRLESVEQRPRLINFLAADRNRNLVISRHIVRALDSGRKVIAFSERRDQIEAIAAILDSGEAGVPGRPYTWARYVGGMTSEGRAEAEGADLLLSTYQMAREGLDIPALDTEVFLSPVSDVEQVIGRILRVKDGKRDPLVLDFVDHLSPRLKKQAGWRARQYRALGYDVRDVR